MSDEQPDPAIDASITGRLARLEESYGHLIQRWNRESRERDDYRSAMDIRLQALEAASRSIGAVWGGIAQAAIETEDPSKHISDERVFRSVLMGAEQFAKWLETGKFDQ